MRIDLTPEQAEIFANSLRFNASRLTRIANGKNTPDERREWAAGVRDVLMDVLAQMAQQ